MRCFAALRTARKDECGSPGQHKKFDAFACSSATQAEPASFASVRRGLHASDAIAAGLALASSQCPRRFNFDLSCRVDPGLLPATSPYKAITVQTGIADRRGLAWSAFRFDRFRSSAGHATKGECEFVEVARHSFRTARILCGPATPSCLCAVVQPAVEWDLGTRIRRYRRHIMPASCGRAFGRVGDRSEDVRARARKRASLIISFRVLSSLCPPRQAHARASPSEAMLREPG